MSKQYRASIFAIFCYGVLLVLGFFWWIFGRSLAGDYSFWGFVILVSIAVIILPFSRASVMIDETGITQHVFRRHLVKWVDIASWERSSCGKSDGPESINLNTCNGSVRLYHNCIYGKRLDEVESELRKRITHQAHVTNGRRPIPSTTNRTSEATSGH